MQWRSECRSEGTGASWLAESAAGSLDDKVRRGNAGAL